MRKYNGRSEYAAITWDDCLSTLANIEEEERVSVYLYLWKRSPGHSDRRWIVRANAVAIGAPYGAKHLCQHIEFWPNGRQRTLSACVMRCLLELQALLAEREARP